MGKDVVNVLLDILWIWIGHRGLVFSKYLFTLLLPTIMRWWC